MNLTANISPQNSTDEIIYEVKNTDILTVDALGNVRFLAEGSAVITVIAGEVSKEILFNIYEYAEYSVIRASSCFGDDADEMYGVLPNRTGEFKFSQTLQSGSKWIDFQLSKKYLLSMIRLSFSDNCGSAAKFSVYAANSLSVLNNYSTMEPLVQVSEFCKDNILYLETNLEYVFYRILFIEPQAEEWNSPTVSFVEFYGKGEYIATQNIAVITGDRLINNPDSGAAASDYLALGFTDSIIHADERDKYGNYLTPIAVSPILSKLNAMSKRTIPVKRYYIRAATIACSK